MLTHEADILNCLLISSFKLEVNIPILEGFSDDVVYRELEKPNFSDRSVTSGSDPGLEGNGCMQPES